MTPISAAACDVSPRRGYLSPGHSNVLEIETVYYYSSALHIFVDFEVYLLKFKHASNRPFYCRVSAGYFPVRLLNDMRI